MTFHARPRFTKVLDLWIDTEAANAERAWRALAAFGAPLGDLSPTDLARPDVVVQIGVAPNRIDLLTRIEGASFAEAWPRRSEGLYGDQPIPVLSRADLIVDKRALGRGQELLDIEEHEIEELERS